MTEVDVVDPKYELQGAVMCPLCMYSKVRGGVERDLNGRAPHPDSTVYMFYYS